jgi:hypothetical protein
VSRCDAFDADVDRRAVAEHQNILIETKARHARTAQAAVASLSGLTGLIVERLQDQDFVRKLQERADTVDGFLEMLALQMRASFALPGLVNMERLALGLTMATIEVDKRDLTAAAKKITSNPELIDLAIRLVHGIAHAGPSAGDAFRAGPSQSRICGKLPQIR